MALLAALTGCAPAESLEPVVPTVRQTLPVVDHAGGVVRAAALYSGYWLWGQGAELSVYAAASAEPVGRVLLGGVIEDIDVEGTRAYLAAGRAGLFVVELSEPSRPVAVAHYPLPALDADANAWAAAVAARGGLAYVALHEGGLWVTGPGAGQAGSPSSGPVSQLHLEGSVLLAVDRAGPTPSYQVWDVSVPAEPRPLGTVATGGEVTDLTVAGDRLYLTTREGNLQIRAWDPAQPLSARLLGELALDDVADFVAVEPGGALVFVSGARGLHQVEVADPAEPALRGVLEGARGELAAGDGQVLIAGDQGGLMRASYADGTLSPLKTLGLPGSSLGLALDLAGRTLFLAQDQQGAARLDLTDARQPLPAGQTPTGFWAQAVAQVPPYLVIADGANVVVLDPGALRVLGQSASPSGEYVRALAPGPQSVVFAAVGAAGVCAVDVALAAQPEWLDCADTPGEGLDVAAAGRTVYVADGRHGVAVVNASDPEHLWVSGGYTEAYGYAVVVDQDDVYVSDAGPPSRLLVLGAGPDGALALSAQVETEGFVRDVAAAGSRVYVANEAGVQIFERRPDGLAEAAVYESAGTAAALAVRDGLIYVADAENGVVVLGE